MAFDWQDWAAFEARPEFVEWAEPPPAETSGHAAGRYAVVHARGDGVRWAYVSPNPREPAELSGGCFYDDMPGGALAECRRQALLHRERVEALVAKADAYHAAYGAAFNAAIRRGVR